jgi:Spy/CpxP family protein refolding chaperone
MILPAALLLAQGPPEPMDPPGPPRTDELKQALDLKDDQVQKLLDLRRQERDSLRPVFQQIGEKRRALHDALESGSSDAASLGNLMLEMKSLHNQIKAANDTYRQQALAILTPEQQAKLKPLEDAAKLAPALHQGVALNLLAPPAGPRGFGLFGPIGPRMGAGRGPGIGPAMGMGRRYGRRL